MTFEAFELLIDSTIYSANTQPHGRMLYGLVRWLQPQVVVEIGSYHGYTAAWLAKGLQDNDSGHLFCVDNFSLMSGSAAQLINNLKSLGVDGQVAALIEGDSLDSKLRLPKCDLVFIDANHSYVGVSNDFLKAVDAGAFCIAVHDTVDWWGPSRLMETGQEYGYTHIEAPHSGGMAIFTRPFQRPLPAYSEEKYPKGYIE